MSEQKKFEVSKVTTDDGRTFYTRETNRARLLTLPGVKRIEDVWMTEDDFNAIPASEDAARFFGGGEQSGTRADAASN